VKGFNKNSRIISISETNGGNNMYCKKCGAQMSEQDVFCTSCGCPAGEQTMNQNQNVFQNVNPVQNKTPGKSAEYMNDIFKVIKGMFISPISTVKDAASNLGKEAGFILGGVVLLLNAFIMFMIPKSGMYKIPGVWYFLGYIQPPLPINIGGPSVVRVLLAAVIQIILSLLTTAIVFGIIFGVILLFSKIIFKGEGSWKNVYNAIVCSLVPYTALLFTATILSFIFLLFSTVLTVGAAAAAVICIYSGVKEGMKISEDKAFLSIAVAFMAFEFMNFIFKNIGYLK
jgi:hypothetical protein